MSEIKLYKRPLKELRYYFLILPPTNVFVQVGLSAMQKFDNRKFKTEKSIQNK
jgi:hypothetical protein